MNKKEFIRKLIKDLRNNGYVVNRDEFLLEVTLFIHYNETATTRYTLDFIYSLYKSNTYKIVLSCLLDNLSNEINRLRCKDKEAV